ncbi:MAG: PQQ-dependent sugar dehydrogenase [Terasakiella sp.]|uniref:PQQ-dependent sugar dehydrogenase n=1 Tax=unclassified Terasakiella TaxID=2614952 RepID=UPI003B005F1A
MKICLFLVALLASFPAFANPILPDGFRLKTFAYVPGARTLVGVPELGIVFVGTRETAIYAILDVNRDGEAEEVRLLSNNFIVPNGLAWKNGFLYVIEQHRLVRYKIGTQLPKELPEPEVLFDQFPNKRWHGWRYGVFGPDGGLYVSIGAPCNICRIRGIEGTILRFDPDTWVPVVFAHGVRNSVGLAFDPITRDLFFTDNGADNMGDDIPADELNRAPVAGLHFGYPYFGGGQSRISDFINETPPANRPPVHAFQAHVAPLGIEFYTGNRFPERYNHGLFVAQHGSWNRSTPVGYRISFHPFDERGNISGEEAFIDGFLGENDHPIARPVDLEQWAHGRLLISDDSEGAVFILDYEE